MANCYASKCPHGKQCVPIAPNYYLYDCPNPPAPPPATTHPQPTIPYSPPGPVEKLTLNKRGGTTTSTNPLTNFFGNLFNEVKNIFTGGTKTETELQPRGIFETRKSAEEAFKRGGTQTTTTTTTTTTTAGSESEKDMTTSFNLFGKEITVSKHMLYAAGVAVMLFILILVMRRY